MTPHPRLDPILVTGCSSGIGGATAKRLAADGHAVYATARRLDTIADLTAAGCRTLQLDVTEERSMAAAVGAVEAEHGAVGALVNNAGYSQSGAIETVPMDDVRRQFETNVFGLARMCQLVLPAMRARRRGRIVNLSSMGGRFTFPGGGYYHATKHAVEAISDALRFEVAGFGIQVVIVEPGIIRTGFAGAVTRELGATAGADPAYADFNARVGRATEQTYEGGPLSRLGGEPEQVAQVIASAIDGERPRTRYLVTPSARLLVTQRRLLPDRVWDRVLASQFRRPGSAR